MEVTSTARTLCAFLFLGSGLGHPAPALTEASLPHGLVLLAEVKQGFGELLVKGISPPPTHFSQGADRVEGTLAIYLEIPSVPFISTVPWPIISTHFT